MSNNELKKPQYQSKQTGRYVFKKAVKSTNHWVTVMIVLTVLRLSRQVETLNRDYYDCSNISPQRWKS